MHILLLIKIWEDRRDFIMSNNEFYLKADWNIIIFSVHLLNNCPVVAISWGESQFSMTLPEAVLARWHSLTKTRNYKAQTVVIFFDLSARRACLLSYFRQDVLQPTKIFTLLSYRFDERRKINFESIEDGFSFFVPFFRVFVKLRNLPYEIIRNRWDLL